MLRGGWAFAGMLAHKRLLLFNATSSRASSEFVLAASFSPITGKSEWKMKPDDYDYVQEVARSAYADMLHDRDRNEKYEAGIRSAVVEIKRRGLRPRVLDIGTGTGLLSMMACRHGAEEVVACEAFLPMADVAETIVKDNGFSEKIKVIRKRSTEMTADADMEGRKANILVTEVFDTELIGEGAILTYRHALENLLTPDCVVVPSMARMYVQVVSSELAWRWHELRCFSVGERVIQIPPEARFPSGDVFYDLQLSELPRSSFTPLTPVMRVFDFDFSGRTRLKDVRTSTTKNVAIADGVAHVVFMWWDLKMDVEGDVWIDMQPSNVPEKVKIPSQPASSWRDHWMQAVYFLPAERRLRRGEAFSFTSSHDAYSLAFELGDDPDAGKSPEISKPAPLPPLLSRPRLGFLNCDETRTTLETALRRVVGAGSVVCCLGEGSVLPFICAGLGARKVFVLDSDRWTSSWTRSIASHNNLSSVIDVVCKPMESLVLDDFGGHLVDVLVSDCYFKTTSLPWDGLYYAFAMRSLKPFLKPDFACLPKEGVLRGACVSMKDLWKIRAPVGESAQGFDLARFDDLVLSAADATDPDVEPQPLWEYPSRIVSDVKDLLVLDIKTLLDSTTPPTSTVDFSLVTSGYNGVAFWMDWHYGEDSVISTGYKHADENGWAVWDRYGKQGIFIDNRNGDVDVVRTTVTFDPVQGDVHFLIDRP